MGGACVRHHGKFSTTWSSRGAPPQRVLRVGLWAMCIGRVSGSAGHVENTAQHDTWAKSQVKLQCLINRLTLCTVFLAEHILHHQLCIPCRWWAEKEKRDQETLSTVGLPPAFSHTEYRSFTLTEMTQLTPDTILYTFALQPGHMLGLTVGQHILLRYNHHTF